MMPNPQLSKLLGYSIGAIKAKAQNIGVKKLIHSNNPYTPQKKALLIELYPNTLNTEIAKILGVSESSVIAAAFRFRLRKTPEFMREHSMKTSFKKGHEPQNKGKKWEDFMSKEAMKNSRKTTFKKGHSPVNYKPVGSEKVNVEGYTEVKIKDPNKWALKHRLVYEQLHGSIPKGYNVKFLDMNRQNFSAENLVLRSRKEMMKENTYHNYPKEIATTIQLLGAMTRQINKRQKQLS
jgi:hypothetical protein